MRQLVKDIAAPRRQARSVPLGRLTILVQVIGAILFVGYTAAKMGVSLPGVTDSYALEVRLPDAAGLDEADEPPVVVAGVPLGKVTKVRREGRGAVATLSMDSASEGKIFADATVELFPRSGVQDLNVVIDPGTSGKRALVEGDRITAGEEAVPVGFDRFTSIFDADTRAYVQILLGEVERALRDRPGELRRAVQTLGPLTSTSRHLADAVADRDRLLARLVSEMDVIFTTTGKRGAQLARAVRNGRRTLEVAGSRDAALAESLRLLPGVLGNARAALDEVSTLSGPLVPALDRLREPSRALPTGLEALRRFIPTGRDLVGELRPLVSAGRRPAADVRNLLAELGPFARESRPGLGRIDKLLQPLAEDETRKGLVRFVEGEAGAQSVGDANGPLGRGMIIEGEPLRPENFGLAPGTSRNSPRMVRVMVDLIASLHVLCDQINPLACGQEYRIPGLTRVLPLLRRAK